MIRTMKYHPEAETEILDGIQPFFELLQDEKSLYWFDFENPNDEESYLLYSDFKFHPLVIEDTITPSNPKLDVFKDYLYMVFRTIDYLKEDELGSREIDFFLGKNYVLSYHKDKFATLDRLLGVFLRDDRLISRGPDFLFHTIVDSLVDDFVATLDKVARRIDSFEESVFGGNFHTDILKQIFELKEDIAEVKTSALAQRDIMWRFSRGEYRLASPDSLVYFRDIYDHLSHVNDKADHFRELLTSVMQAYFSAINDKTNQIMKTLTIFTAVLLPLSVIASIYGMNFVNMPELRWEYGYYYALSLMFAVGAGTLIFFKLKGWL